MSFRLRSTPGPRDLSQTLKGKLCRGDDLENDDFKTIVSCDVNAYEVIMNLMRFRVYRSEGFGKERSYSYGN